MIDSAAYQKTMTAYTQKIGTSLSPLMATFYRDVLSHDLETEDFLRGARIVYKQELTRWPAPYALSVMIATAAGVQPRSVPVVPETPAKEYPSVGLVREHLGELIADAYASAGPAALWSDDDNVQQPAILEFEKALAAAVVRSVVRGDIPKWANYQPAPHPRCLLPKDSANWPDPVSSLASLVQGAAT